LKQALAGPRKRSFAEILTAMPNVGRDEDFTRAQEQPLSDVFD
jgi:hypothetical protein